MNMRRQVLYRLILAHLCFCATIPGFAQRKPVNKGDRAARHELYSPDGMVRCTVTTGDSLRISIHVRDSLLLAPSVIGMHTTVGQGFNTQLPVKVLRRSVEDSIIPPVPFKRKVISDRYRELRLDFGRDWSLECRAYNDGIAYRFLLHRKDSIVIASETARYEAVGTAGRWIYPEVVKRETADIFHTSFEEPYQLKPADSILNGAVMFTPVLWQARKGLNMVITESDLHDYPGMFLRKNGPAMEGYFAGYPKKEVMAEGEFPQMIVTEREPFIAHTRGDRAFPWRVFIIGEDKVLPSSDLVYRLASAPAKNTNWSWVKPGQGTDEWIINIALYNVPFKAGINTETYLYYIDFAKKSGLERIMMDAGWSDVKDLFKINPDLDMDRIAAYAKQQGIGLSMWTLAHTLNRQLEPALEQFNKWGVDFVMTDFIDRDDQPMVNFHHRIAEACARRKIMVMFHGSFKPAGFERTWPNSVTREGVLGSEYNAWSTKATPANNVLNAFIRMTSGPLDYEPGLLDNAGQFTFRPVWGKVMSQGTRCHQLAMFAVYDSQIQIFCGNPSTGMQEPDFMGLLGSIPCSWDETVVPAAELGEYVVSARRQGATWFMAGLNNWTARNLSLSLDFLPPGKAFKATICVDGVNADKYASDYRIFHKTLQKGEVLPVELASGGGFLVRFDPL